MVATRTSAQTLESPANPNNHQIYDNGRTQIKTKETQKVSGYDNGRTQINDKETQKVSGYEQLREERIKENLERMQKLGILNLSLRLKSIKPTRKNFSSNSKTPPCLSPSPPPGPSRRSSRLQNVTPVSYSEVKLDTPVEGEHHLLTEGSKPEVYTEEHEKLLGNTEMSWTLFVDGYGQDGRRIYDPVKGKTCHQCRQKTLGHRTHCSKCSMVQGQFCGDCLYMRYGEHVLEAKENPNWICPACRGICNCSLCRQAKGWPPTGPFYRKISQLGFKSVAHYLIQTRRSQTDSDKSPDTKIPASARRSLPFSDVEETSDGKESPMSNNDSHRLIIPKYEKNKRDDMPKVEKMEEMNFSENYHGASNNASGNSQELSKLESEDNKTDGKFKVKNVAPGSIPKSKRKTPHTPEPTPDSICARLRQSRSNGDEDEMISTNEESSDDKQAIKYVPSESETKANTCQSSSANSSVDGIAGRLRLRCKRT